MEHELIIGKYTLESLTNGMYASPMDLYREYIQNAVDSIDDAIEQGLEPRNYFEIAIHIDTNLNNLSIFDNGCGLSCNNAVATLVDIGNSNKHRNLNRGFRGIGRLAGLGYCDELIFTTSYTGEAKKTIVRFDAKLLRKLLLVPNQNNVSVSDVMQRIVSLSEAPEKSAKHYFNVELHGITEHGGLLNVSLVEEYLKQHAPLPYSPSFKWQSPIIEKIKIAGYSIPSYCICLNGHELYKPYTDDFISDRIKKIYDHIEDINIVPFYREETLSAVLWYAQTAFFGTINDNSIKGIRIRQGNILIGDRTSCNSLFKEERFNGWMIGELHVLDPSLIVNSRRDGFEKNDAYYSLSESFKEWALTISKEIRKISYDRSLSREKKAVVDAEDFEDINDLCSEDLDYAADSSESDYLDSGESEVIAETDYIDKLSQLLNQRKSQTKYRALNINNKLTQEQRKVLERVFDLIQSEYTQEEAESFINTIAKLF